MEENKPVKKRPVYLIVAMAFIAIAIMAGITVYQMRSGLFGDYNATLFITAKALNLTCPRDLGGGIRLDSAAAKRELQFIYYYTLTKDITKENCDNYKESIIEKYAGNSDLKEFGQHNVTLTFVLRDDENGKMICSLNILASEYYPSTSN